MKKCQIFCFICHSFVFSENDRYTQESNYRSFMQKHQFDYSYPRSSLSKLSSIDDSISLSNNRENNFDDNLQMIIQTVNDNTKESMLEHSRMLVDVANYQIQLFGELVVLEIF